VHAPAADQARAETEAHGPIPFQRFMHLALYGEGGFYHSGGRAGRRGDFLTSPEVGPLFGVVLSRMLEAEWRRLGEPDDFTVVEVGAGPGTLARSIRAAAGPWLARYLAVEVSESQRARHPQGVESLESLPVEPVRGVVLANELLDNLPCAMWVFDGAWREAFVDVDRERFVEVLSAPIAAFPAWLPETAAHGARVPVQQSASLMVEKLRSVLVSGRTVLVDYVEPRSSTLSQRAWRDWLRTYRGHERGDHYLTAPGSQDITLQVCLDQLPAPDVVHTQAQYLARWGIDELVEEGRAAWTAAAAAPSVAALTMRSRLRESEALLAADGLGAFLVLEWAS
jgi:SAM-dependent MidA family methyltransferase